MEIGVFLEFGVELPTQFFLGKDGGRAYAEKRLLAAILFGALLELDSSNIAIARRAREWFQHGSLGHFTAREVCEFLGLHYPDIRDAALAGRVRVGRRGRWARKYSKKPEHPVDEPFGAVLVDSGAACVVLAVPAVGAVAAGG